MAKLPIMEENRYTLMTMEKLHKDYGGETLIDVSIHKDA